MFKMLIIVITSTADKSTFFFRISKELFKYCGKNIVGKGPLKVRCELCVYGQGRGETEMITRVLLRTQLGASLN